MRKWLLFRMNLRMRKTYVVRSSAASACLPGDDEYSVACGATSNESRGFLVLLLKN